MRSLSTAVFAAVLALSVGQAHATTWYVKAGATGNGKAKETPAGKISNVLLAARAGDVVNVAAGDYNGTSDAGQFMINVPNLSLVGGWSDDFSSRNPFTNISLLRRKPGVKTNYNSVEDGIICMNPQAHKDGGSVSCSGLIVDGFVIDGATRNIYNPNDGRLGAQGSWKGSLVKIYAAETYSNYNLSFRNCVLMNCYNIGVEVKWQGDKNEISNCLLISNMIASIDCRGAQPPVNGPTAIKGFPATKVRIVNNTIAYNWEHDKAQMANGIMLGSAGTYTVENNVISWLIGPGSMGVRDYDDQDVVRGNVFWVTGDGEAIVKKQAGASQMGGGDEEEEEEEEGGSGGSSLAGNVVADPGFTAKLDKGWFATYSGYAGKFSKLPLDVVARGRKLHDLFEITKAGQAMPPDQSAWGVKYPNDDYAKVFEAFKAAQPGKGFRTDVKFETYEERLDTSVEGAVPGPKDDYAMIEFVGLTKKSTTKPADSTKVKLKATLRTRGMRWAAMDKGYTPDKYIQIEIGKPGDNPSGNTTNKMFAYIVRGSQAGKRWNEFGVRGKNKLTKGGVWVRGTVYETSQPANNNVKYIMVIDYIGKAK